MSPVCGILIFFILRKNKAAFALFCLNATYWCFSSFLWSYWYWCHYLHTSRDSVFPACLIFFFLEGFRTSTRCKEKPSRTGPCRKDSKMWTFNVGYHQWFRATIGPIWTTMGNPLYWLHTVSMWTWWHRYENTFRAFFAFQTIGDRQFQFWNTGWEFNHLYEIIPVHWENVKLLTSNLQQIFLVRATTKT